VAQLHTEPGRRAIGEFEVPQILNSSGSEGGVLLRERRERCAALRLIFMGAPHVLTGHLWLMKCRKGLHLLACSEHRRRKVQKLTGGMGGVPPCPFFLDGGRSSAKRCAANAASARSASFHGSAAKQCGDGRAVCKTRRVGWQRLDYASRITKMHRTPEIASPRLRAMAPMKMRPGMPLPPLLRIALALLRPHPRRVKYLRGDPSNSPRMGCAPATPAGFPIFIRLGGPYRAMYSSPRLLIISAMSRIIGILVRRTHGESPITRGIDWQNLGLVHSLNGFNEWTEQG
jgi:hypothetical protein